MSVCREAKRVYSVLKWFSLLRTIRQSVFVVVDEWSSLWQRDMFRAQTVLSSHKTSTGCFGSCGTARGTHPFTRAQLFFLTSEIDLVGNGVWVNPLTRILATA